MVNGSAAVPRPDSVAVEFDDERLIANAGLLLTSTLGRAARPRAAGRRDRRPGERAGAEHGPGARCSRSATRSRRGPTRSTTATSFAPGATEAILGPRGDGALDPRHLPALIHTSGTSASSIGCWAARSLAPGPPAPARAPIASSSTSTASSARCTAMRSRAPRSPTPASAATTRSSQLGPIPARCSTSASARAGRRARVAWSGSPPS